ncbi:hypothetical protein SNE40_019709 [Patella caerulea]|uniref:Uncharacterized protein n=1 Tax=Patella caerulea TaxID=87958 RepID=A0AAN8JB11_PATCE
MDWEAGAELYGRYSKWKQKCETTFEGTIHDLSEEIQCKYLLIWSGDRGFDFFISWNLSQKLSKYWERFSQFVNPQVNFLVA